MDNLRLYFGDAVKALDDSGRVGGYLVKFSDGSQRDLHGEYFDKNCDYGPTFGDMAECLFEHGFPLGKDEFFKQLADHKFQPIRTRKDELGIFAETLLNIENDYEKIIWQHVKAGKIGWSSGSAGHRVKIEDGGRIVRWPIAEGSLTPRPANPLSRAFTLKSHTLKSYIELREAEEAAAPDIFEREMAAVRPSKFDLWETFTKCVTDIAKAGTTVDVTGVPVDVDGLVREAANGFAKSLSKTVTSEINEYLARPSDRPFYLQEGADARLKSLLTDSDVAFRASLTDHSDVVASAVEEFVALSQALAKSVKEYAGRAERKRAFRLKEGRVLSAANINLMDGCCGRMKQAADEMMNVHSMLSSLIESARKPTPDEMTKRAEEQRDALRAKWLRIEAARVGIDAAA